MKVEVMPATVAAQQLRQNGHGRGQQDESRAGQVVPALEISRSLSRKLGHSVFRTDP